MIMKMKNGEYYDDNGDNFDGHGDENYQTPEKFHDFLVKIKSFLNQCCPYVQKVSTHR